MGTIVLQSTTVITTANMKLFLVAALLIASACAEPESDSESKPWLAYGNYGYGYPAYGYAGYAGYAGHYGYAGYPYATHGYRHFWKREADSESEAKPDADAWYSLYGHGLTYPYATNAYVAGYPYAHATYAAPAVTTVGRYVAPYYNAYGLGYHHALGKREAESDSEAKPDAWYNYYGNAYGYPYANGYNGYALPYARTYAGYGYGLRSYARWL